MVKFVFINLFFIFIIKESSQSTISFLGENSDFCYKEPWCGPESSKWPEICKTGQNQSPIDLPYSSIANRRATKRSILFTKYQSPSFYIWNDGHTLIVSFSPNFTSKAEMSWDGLENAYIFAQLHFHWGQEGHNGSEHTVNGKQFKAEAHFVHYSSKYSSFEVALASGDPKALSVIAVFIEPVRNLFGFFDNTAFRKIMQNISTNYHTTMHKINNFIDLKALLPKYGKIFYNYLGSLTAPDCNEVVQWIIFINPLKVGWKNYRKLYSLRDNDGNRIGNNFRAVQSPNGRSISVFRQF